MLYIHKGKTNKSVSDSVYSVLKNCDPGRRHILIVPEQFTLSAEFELLDSIGKCGSMNIEVISFARLADKLVQGPCLTETSAVMLMRKVIYECGSGLKCFKNSCARIGFASEMYAAVTALRKSNVHVENLRNALPGLNGFMRNKVHDIVYIYDSYLNNLKTIPDMTTRFEYMVNAVAEDEHFGNTDIYILDYYSFTNKQFSAVEQFIKICPNVHIGLVNNDSAPNSRIFPDKTLKRLIAIAKHNGILFKEIYNTPAAGGKPAVKDILNDFLFSYMKPVPVGNSGEVNIYEGRDAYDEIEYAARRICSLIYSGDYRYKDIAVVTGDKENYAKILRHVFNKYDVPHYLDKKIPLIETSVLRLIMSALKLTVNGCRVEEIIEILKNPLGNFSDSEADEYQNHAFKFGLIRDSGKAADYKLQSKEKTYDGFVNAIRDFTLKFNIGKRIEDFADKLVAAGDNEAAQVQMQSLIKLNNILAELGGIMGPLPCGTEEFLEVLTAMAGEAEISVLPQTVDCVYIGSTAESRFLNKKALFVIGAVEGGLIKESTGGGIVSERDIAELKRHNIVVEPSAEAINHEEKLNLLQILLAGEKLYISYPLSGADGESAVAANIIKQIMSLIGTDAKPLITDRTDSFEDDRHYSGITRAELAAFKYPTAEIAYNAFKKSEEPEKATEKLNLDLIGNTQLSASRLESYFHCPYSHFIRYNLNAREREDAKFNPVNIGNILHEAAEKYIRTGKKLSIKEIEFETCGSDKLLKRQIEAEIDYVIDLIDEHLNGSEFKPCKDLLEVQLTAGGFTGKLDRVDILRTQNSQDIYAVIYDYKTGAHEDGSLADVYFGKKLQLYLYLSAVMKKYGYKPYGVFYFNLRRDDKKAVLGGQVLLSEDYSTLQAIDNRFPNSKFLPHKLRKDNGKLTTRKDFLTEEQFYVVAGYAEKAAVKAAAELKQGYIFRSPVELKGGKTNCGRCGYSDICGKVNVYRPVKIKDVFGWKH